MKNFLVSLFLSGFCFSARAQDVNNFNEKYFVDQISNKDLVSYVNWKNTAS